MLQLRNHIENYKPIFHWINLKDKHLELLETAKWIKVPLKRLCNNRNRFSDVCNLDLKNNRGKFKQPMYVNKRFLNDLN